MSNEAKLTPSVYARVKPYLPRLMLNDREPYELGAVGISILDKPGPSPSFKRDIIFDPAEVAYAIEFSMYWDYDIGHLFDLEHIWVYVGHDGGVVDCEGSFHGRYSRVLRSDRTNLLGKQVVLCSQPGKHGFAYSPEILMLDPDFMRSATSPDYVGGLLITDILRGRMENTPEIKAVVDKKLLRDKFVPSETYHLYDIPDSILMDWDALWAYIPVSIQAELDRLFAQE